MMRIWMTKMTKMIKMKMKIKMNLRIIEDEDDEG